MESIKLVVLVAEFIAKSAVEMELDNFGAPPLGAHTVECRGALQIKEIEQSLMIVQM
jgi:hypothetical protein